MSGYDVQRWDWVGDGIEMMPGGNYVLAADAEAHERAAVEAAIAIVTEVLNRQRILHNELIGSGPVLIQVGQVEEAVTAALRALLPDGGER